jgi:hypothetical protein
MDNMFITALNWWKTNFYGSLTTFVVQLSLFSLFGHKIAQFIDLGIREAQLRCFYGACEVATLTDAKTDRIRPFAGHKGPFACRFLPFSGHFSNEKVPETGRIGQIWPFHRYRHLPTLHAGRGDTRNRCIYRFYSRKPSPRISTPPNTQKCSKLVRVSGTNDRFFAKLGVANFLRGKRHHKWSIKRAMNHNGVFTMNYEF